MSKEETIQKAHAKLDEKWDEMMAGHEFDSYVSGGDFTWAELEAERKKYHGWITDAIEPENLTRFRKISARTLWRAAIKNWLRIAINRRLEREAKYSNRPKAVSATRFGSGGRTEI